MILLKMAAQPKAAALTIYRNAVLKYASASIDWKVSFAKRIRSRLYAIGFRGV
jgi:hypothetical protein